MPYRLLATDHLLADLESRAACSNTQMAISLNVVSEHSSLQLPFSVHLSTAVSKESEWLILVSHLCMANYLWDSELV